MTRDGEAQRPAYEPGQEFRRVYWRERLYVDLASDRNVSAQAQAWLDWAARERAEVSRILARSREPGDVYEVAAAKHERDAEDIVAALAGPIVREAARRWDRLRDERRAEAGDPDARARRQRRQRTKLTADQLAERHAARLTPVGRHQYKAACPFHDDTTPSLWVYPDHKYYCFACGAYGPVSRLQTAWEIEEAGGTPDGSAP